MTTLTLYHNPKSRSASARVLLEEARKRRPTDSFVIQRLALSTYKSKQPDAVTALNDALARLRRRVQSLPMRTDPHRRLHHA